VAFSLSDLVHYVWQGLCVVLRCPACCMIEVPRSMRWANPTRVTRQARVLIVGERQQHQQWQTRTSFFVFFFSGLHPEWPHRALCPARRSSHHCPALLSCHVPMARFHMLPYVYQVYIVAITHNPLCLRACGFVYVLMKGTD
jgi:hypothetical protein